MAAAVRPWRPLSQDTVSGTGFKTYLGHVWSEEDWYEDYTTKPPRDNLGSWEADKGVFATGYLLDRKFFPPKAGLPKAFGFFHHGVTGNKVVARSDEEDFSGQAKQALQRLAQLGPRTAADMGLATIKGAKKTATPRALPEHLQDQVQPKFQIREDSDPDSEADDDMTSCFTRMSGQTVSAEIASRSDRRGTVGGDRERAIDDCTGFNLTVFTSALPVWTFKK